MKIIESEILWMTNEDLKNIVDNEANQIDIYRCNNCGKGIALTEAIIEKNHWEELKFLKDKFNQAIEDVMNAPKEVYGEDIVNQALIKKLKKIKSDFYKLEVVDGGKK